METIIDKQVMQAPFTDFDIANIDGYSKQDQMLIANTILPVLSKFYVITPEKEHCIECVLHGNWEKVANGDFIKGTKFANKNSKNIADILCPVPVSYVLKKFWILSCIGRPLTDADCLKSGYVFVNADYSNEVGLMVDEEDYGELDYTSFGLGIPRYL